MLELTIVSDTIKGIPASQAWKGYEESELGKFLFPYNSQF